MDCSLPRLLHPWDFPGKSTGVGCHCLLQGIFPTQGSNPGLLHCRQDTLTSEPPGKPFYKGTRYTLRIFPRSSTSSLSFLPSSFRVCPQSSTKMPGALYVQSCNYWRNRNEQDKFELVHSHRISARQSHKPTPDLLMQRKVSSCKQTLLKHMWKLTNSEVIVLCL